MNLLRFKYAPALLRTVPFFVFVLLTFCQNHFGDKGRYWFYLAKTLVGAGMLWVLKPYILEMRWQISWEAIVVGIGVFVMWVGLGDFLEWAGINHSFFELKLSARSWQPFLDFGPNSAQAWFFICARILGASLVVPLLEEVFFRSFLYRYIAKPDFQSVPLGKFLAMPFLISAVLFGFEHREWLAGILCALPIRAWFAAKAESAMPLPPTL